MSYSDEQLRELLSQPESHWVERKESFSNKDAICKTICAFANDLANSGKHGLIWIGLNDRGELAGLNINDELLQKIDQIKAEGKIQPLPSLTVRQLGWAQGFAIAIVVAPSLLPPVAYDGRIWVRMAASTQLANAEDERQLAERRRTTAGRSFDSEALTQTTVSDLDKTYFNSVYLPQAVAPDVLNANGRTYEERLVSTRMAVGTHPTTPTVAGILTAGISSQDWLAGAYVQFIRYSGIVHGGDVLDERRIMGNLETVIKSTEDLFKANIKTAISITEQDREIRRPDYPLAALQQLFRNAILHRNYEGTNTPVRVYWFDDRIEIANPGGPFGTVTSENFGQPFATDYRNPIVAEVLYNLSFVQKFGFGIQNAKKTLLENGNGEPKFTLSSTLTIVSIRKVLI